MMSFLTLPLAFALLAAASPTLINRGIPTANTQIPEAQAREQLIFYDSIKVISSTNCGQQSGPKCVSLESIRQGVIQDLVSLQDSCSPKTSPPTNTIPIFVTGGTEGGYEQPGSTLYTHKNGYKLTLKRTTDLAACVNQFKPAPPVENHKAFFDKENNLFIDFGSFFDVTFNSWIAK